MAVPNEQLDAAATLVAKDEDRSVEGVGLEFVAEPCDQAVVLSGSRPAP